MPLFFWDNYGDAIYAVSSFGIRVNEMTGTTIDLIYSILIAFNNYVSSIFYGRANSYWSKV